VSSISNSPHPCSSNLKGGFLKSGMSYAARAHILRVGFSKEGCNLYVTLSIKDAGNSCPSGPNATILTDHLRMG